MHNNQAGGRGCAAVGCPFTKIVKLLALILAGSEACGWLLLACLACLMHSLVFPPWVGPLRLGPTSPRIAGGQTLPFVFVIITRVSRHGISARSIARTPIYRTHTTSLVRLLGGRC